MNQHTGRVSEFDPNESENPTRHVCPTDPNRETGRKREMDPQEESSGVQKSFTTDHRLDFRRTTSYSVRKEGTGRPPQSPYWGDDPDEGSDESTFRTSGNNPSCRYFRDCRGVVQTCRTETLRDRPRP